MRVHVIQTGRLIGNKTFLRGSGWSSLLRRREPFDFPVYSYIVEHPDGHIAIDTGLGTTVACRAPNGASCPARSRGPRTRSRSRCGPRDCGPRT